MFGGQDDNVQGANGGGMLPQTPQDDTLKGVDDLAASLPAPSDPAVPSDPGSAGDSGMSDGGGFMPSPSEPAQSVPAPMDTPSDNATPIDSSASMTNDDDLLQLKQESLQKLTPLVGHLNQSPEEKFRTLMMLIQASDNQSLLREAYSTALQISNEEMQAQALLDVVNEINYFHQAQQQGQQPLAT